MQFKVPQDVQREDTIIGPVTLKQLMILLVGGGIAYALYISISKTYMIEAWLPPVVIVSAITLAFAFLKIHNLNFTTYIMCFLEYHLLSRQRIWIQGSGYPFISPFDDSKKKAEPKKVVQPKSTKSLDELTKVLDTDIDSNTSPSKKEGLAKLINQNY